MRGAAYKLRSSFNLVSASVMSVSAGWPYLPKSSLWSTTTTSSPSRAILTRIGRSLTWVAFTSADGKTFLMKRVAASRSWNPPSQLAQKVMSNLSAAEVDIAAARERAVASTRLETDRLEPKSAEARTPAIL